MSAASSDCPVCGSAETQDVVTIRSVPVYCNVLWPSRAAAREAARGDLALRVCRTCAHVYNAAFDPARMAYTPAYENSLHFSPRFQAYAEALADDLIARHGLRGKTIVEIGSGQGDFLALLCERGGNTGLGFDPSYRPEPDGAAEGRPFTIIPDYYSERYAHHPADLVCSRHVLEHIPAPREFLARIRRAVGDRPGTVIFCEVPNVRYTLRDLGIWDLIYEHCSYFSASSLAGLFADCGFAVDAVAEAYAGQFLTLEARPGVAASPPPDPTRAAVLAEAGAFADHYRAKRAHWEAELRRWEAAGRRAALWGAGSKGVTFLNTFADQRSVEYVVDINPRKQGQYVAGTGQPIVAPEALAQYRPDVVVVMNPVYQDEIRQALAGLGLSPEVLCA